MTSRLAISAARYSDAGVKDENQDFDGLVVPDNHRLETKGIAIAVADGVSTSEAGREASEASVTGFLSDYYSTPESWKVHTSAGKVLNSINRWLYAQSQSSPSHRYGYVTTFSAMVLKSNTAHLFHVGDSRIYRLRGNEFEQLTRDHRVFVSDEEHYLSRALGIDLHLDIDYRTVDIQPGDCFLLSTDGIHDYLDSKTIESVLRENTDDLEKTVNTLGQRTMDAGTLDNLTCQLVRIDETPDPDADEFYQRLTQLPFPPDLQRNQTIDGFRILREIHASKRSQCYLAVDTESDEQVVVKTPSVNFEDDPVYIKLFLQEEWIGKRINNPHVMKMHDLGRRRNFLYQVAEYSESKTLRVWMHDNPKPSLDDVRNIADQVARGLRAFHRLEIIHRDLKPENIVIDSDGCVRIIDFGSARIAGEEETLSPLEETNLVGTIDYSAPEFLLGAAGNEKSDQYSLAVILYEMLTGRLPFNKELSRRNMYSRRYIAASESKVVLPAWVEGAIERALDPDPDKRYEDISEFVYDLSHPNSKYIHTEPLPYIERNPAGFWRGLALLLLVINLVLVYLLNS